MKKFRVWMKENRWTPKLISQEIRIVQTHISAILSEKRGCSRKIAEKLEIFCDHAVLASEMMSPPPIKAKCPCCGVKGPISRLKWKKEEVEKMEIA